MIPELLSMIFNCDVVKMSVQTVMGEDVGNDIREGHPYFATQNLHSDRKGILNRIDFSPEIQKYIIRKNIYKKPVSSIYSLNPGMDDRATKISSILLLLFPCHLSPRSTIVICAFIFSSILIMVS